MTKSSKGVKKHRTLSTALKASVSHALCKRNRPVNPRQRAAKVRQPRMKLRVRSPAIREAAPAMAVKTASATALPALNRLRRLGIM